MNVLKYLKDTMDKALASIGNILYTSTTSYMTLTQELQYRGA